MTTDVSNTTKRTTKTVPETAELVAALRDRGVRYLLAVNAADSPPALTMPELIGYLSRHPEARLREALIPLFIRNAEGAHTVQELLHDTETVDSEVVHHMYTAAAYLQRLWQSTLGIYLGDIQLLPDLFGQSKYKLPPPTEHYGEAGLRVLAAYFQQRTGYDWLSAYESVISLFLQQLMQEELSHA